MREEVDRFKGKVEVIKQVSVWPKNRVERDRSENGIEQFRLNNVGVKREHESMVNGSR